MLGDVNGDGVVDISDVTQIQRYIADVEPLEWIYIHAADSNQNGNIDISDATILQMAIADYNTGYPIGLVMTQ